MTNELMNTKTYYFYLFYDNSMLKKIIFGKILLIVNYYLNVFKTKNIDLQTLLILIWFLCIKKHNEFNKYLLLHF